MNKHIGRLQARKKQLGGPDTTLNQKGYYDEGY